MNFRSSDAHDERRKLEQAILVLQQQQALLTPAVTETVLTVLRDKLMMLQTAVSLPMQAQRKQVTVLFAQVSGLTRLVETTSDTGMLNLMNVLWQQMDQAIKNQGGIIDKHMGDAVLGVFGMPVAQEDDPVRAIRAALDMRAVLSDFLQELQQRDGRFHPYLSLDLSQIQDLQIRIGINTGPVLLGRVGSGDEYTVIGDAVNVGRRLEQTAAPGGILISHDTYLQVHGVFNVEALGQVRMKGRTDPVLAYVVLGMRPRLFQAVGRGVEGVETQMIGRDAELQQLQKVVLRTIESRQGQLLTIVGDAGVGKSRLLHEFSRWLQKLPLQGVTTLKGRMEQAGSSLPYALVRDLLTSHFGIQDNERTTLAEEKFVQGMRQVVKQSEAEIRLRARVLGRLIGLGFAEPDLGDVTQLESQKLRERAFRYVVGYLAAVTAVSEITIIFLEDIHWSDQESLFLVKHLSRLCRQEPLLIICLARPTLLEIQPNWADPATTTAVHDLITLDPLSEQESYQLVQNILRKLPEVPAVLADPIVAQAEGNPFYVEELIKSLIEDGLIIPTEQAWRLHAKRLTKVRVPATLTGVLQARLDRLSSMERITLQKAAVVGRLFWDSIICQMMDVTGPSLTIEETMRALQALEQRELVFARHSSGFGGAQAYIFKHTLLRDVTYESVLLRQRPLYHKQVADWLVQQSGERLVEYAGIIAAHYELAEDHLAAAHLYDMAAKQAQELYHPEQAIDYYRKVLDLLSNYTDQTADLLRVQESLGDLLVMQARLLEAAQIFLLMQHTARLDGDLEAQARAGNRLARLDESQGHYAAMLEHASQAEQVAWLVNVELELVQALIYKGWAYHHLGKTPAALVSARRALELNEHLYEPKLLTSSFNLLCEIHISLGEAEKAMVYLNRLDEQATQLQADRRMRRAVAFIKTSLGGFFNQLGQYDRAARQLLDALRLYQEIDHQVAVGNTLTTLGETARMQGNSQAAVTLQKQALKVAQSVGDRYGELFYRTNLAGAYVHSGQFAAAIQELVQVIRQSEDFGRVVNWSGLAEAYRYLAEAYLGLQEFVAAKTAVLQAFHHLPSHNYKAEAIVWRVLGQTLIAPGETITFQMRDAPQPGTYDALACFQQSLQRLRQVTSLPLSVQREQATTLWAWANHAARMGQTAHSQQLRRQAMELAERIRFRLPTTTS